MNNNKKGRDGSSKFSSYTLYKYTSDSYKFVFDVLDNAHVGVTPGVDFGSEGEGFIRLSYANSLENIKEGLDRLENYFSSLKI
ncbi:MAG: hypothetical protein JJE45_06915 [Prolixibacteraceae bacterium]|nr:hypothetical protein [Prolixibacteraceae bacterium]